ncbi:hypothetical protein F2Q70_00000303 [Brassica cretica]|uniref:Di19 C-terminal domain-containing protein n=1 Tax=Brassica cretica TaxID=69181 RepID=A0A8S9J5F7_BRACR|nr:hypothetical protein F2Q70_00000303 [Brassica cretica]
MGFLLPILLGVFLLITATPPSLSQLPPEIDPPAPAPISPSELCNGIFLSYTFILGRQIPPNDTTDQPYRFESVLTVLNNGREELQEWRVFVGFQHHEILTSATDAIIVNGTDLPAPVGNGTIFAGYPVSDLKTAIQTAGDLKQMTATIELVGTQFMVAPPAIPLPSNISLVNDGWSCPEPTATPLSKRQITTCCIRDPTFEVNTTTITDKFLPRQPGDLTIMYDVIRAYDQNYLAEVTMENHNPLGRLDHWELSFDWMREEFIQKMQGAYPTVVDATKCIFGPQSQIYTGLDFADVLTCERRPIIVDLPPTKAEDPVLGKIPSCCRNGTILPRTMDPSKSASVFTMQRRRRLRRGGYSSNYLTLRKSLGVGGASTFIPSSNLDSDPLLSSFMFRPPLANELVIPITEGDSVTKVSPKDTSQRLSLSNEDQEKARKSEFVRDLLWSTMLEDKF